jgi:hypothetical protein
MSVKIEQRIPRGSGGFGGFAQIRSAEIREIRLIRVEFLRAFHENEPWMA